MCRNIEVGDTVRINCNGFDFNPVHMGEFVGLVCVVESINLHGRITLKHKTLTKELSRWSWYVEGVDLIEDTDKEQLESFELDLHKLLRKYDATILVSSQNKELVISIPLKNPITGYVEKFCDKSYGEEINKDFIL